MLHLCPFKTKPKDKRQYDAPSPLYRPADMIICVYSSPVLLISSHLTCQECVAHFHCDNGLGVEMGQQRFNTGSVGFPQGISVYTFELKCLSLEVLVEYMWLFIF